MAKHLGAVLVDEVDASPHGANPLAVAAVHHDGRHIGAIEQVVGIVGAIVARHFGLYGIAAVV